MAKILIIEDDYYVRVGLKELLLQSNFTVEEMENGIDAGKKIKTFEPDLVICDVMMKGENGYEVLQKLRNDNCFVPFIFLTAKCELQDIRRGMSLGADDYFIKPYRAKDLLKAVNFRIKKHKDLQNDASQNAETKSESGNSVIIVNNKVPTIVKFDQIVYVKAESEYSTVYLKDGEKIFVRKLLKNWEEKLPSENFLRIHRSTIVNLNFVESIQKNVNSSYTAVLKFRKIELSISYRYARKIKKNLNF